MFTKTGFHEIILTIPAKDKAMMTLTVRGPLPLHLSRTLRSWAIDFLTTAIFGDVDFDGASG